MYNQKNRLAGSPEQSKNNLAKRGKLGEGVCQHHNVNTAGRDQEEEEGVRGNKKEEGGGKGNEKHKHLIKCRSGLDKAGLFSSVQFTVNNFSVVGYMQRSTSGTTHGDFVCLYRLSVQVLKYVGITKQFHMDMSERGGKKKQKKFTKKLLHCFH